MLPERVHRPAGEEGDAVSISDLAQAYQLSENLFRLRLRMASPLVGMRLDEADLPGRFDVTVLSIQQWPDRRSSPLPAAPAGPDTILSAQDILHVQGAPERVALLARDARMGIVPANEEQGELLPQELGMAEVLLTPRSRLIGQTLVNSRFRDKYRVTVLGVMRLGKLVTGPVGTIELRFGDTLLVQGTWQSISLLSQESHDFVVVGQPAEMARARPAARRAPVALACMVGMLVLLAFNIVPNVVAVLLAAVLMVLTGCLSMEDAYKGMNWSSLILLAGMLPMATALQKSGGVQYVANLLTNSLGQWGPLPVMVGLFLLTGFFSQFISNTATTVLVAPIALQAALTLGVAPYAFLMTAVSLKAALMPLFSWLPKAHGTPGAPTVVSAVLSGLYVKGGVYLFFRLQDIFEPVLDTRSLFLVLGLMTAVIGFVLAIAQKDIKLILAYHTVSQIGLIMTGLNMDHDYARYGALYHIINHAIFKATLFLTAGLVIEHYKTRQIGQIRGVWREMPAVALASLLAILGITGAPLFNGSMSKAWIMVGADQAWLGIALYVINLGTVISFVKYSSMLWGKAPGKAKRPFWGGPGHRLPALVCLSLGTLCLLGGVLSEPMTRLLFGVALPVDWSQYGRKTVVFLLLLFAGTAIYHFGLKRWRYLQQARDLDLSFHDICLTMAAFFAALVIVLKIWY